MTEPDTASDEISLLEIAVVLAENWVLIVVPVLVAALTFGALSVATPKRYDSEALVRDPRMLLF